MVIYKYFNGKRPFFLSVISLYSPLFGSDERYMDTRPVFRTSVRAGSNGLVVVYPGGSCQDKAQPYQGAKRSKDAVISSPKVKYPQSPRRCTEQRDRARHITTLQLSRPVAT